MASLSSKPHLVSDTLLLVEAALHILDTESAAVCYGIEAESTDIVASQGQLLKLVEEWVRKTSSPKPIVGLSGYSLGQIDKNLRSVTCSVIDLNGENPNPDLTSLVVEGSIRGLDQLSILLRARQLLVEGGQLILFGEFIAEESEICPSELANLSSILQLSQRLGFQCNQQQDHTAGAQRSIALLLGHIQENKPRILNSLGWEGDRLEAVTAELEFISLDFESGHRSFLLFEFTKSLTTAEENAQAEYGDIDSFLPQEISQLFENSFGTNFDPELWAWKYQAGNGTCVVAREEQGGEIVSHYGGAPRNIYYFGERALALQSCDVMVAPKLRKHFGKKSLFFKTAATFLEREEGNSNKHLLGFGFPNQAAMNIAIRSGLYEKTDDFVELVFSQQKSTPSKYRTEDLDIEKSAHRDAIDLLWEKMREGFGAGIIGIRDAQYVAYRYFQHPFSTRGLLTRKLIIDEKSGEAVAVIVLKDHDEHRLLLDIIAPLDQLPEQLMCANHYVSTIEQKSMKLWITQGWLDAVKEEGCTVNKLGIEIPCNSWNPGPSAEALYGAWWLTAGDMDFV